MTLMSHPTPYFSQILKEYSRMPTISVWSFSLYNTRFGCDLWLDLNLFWAESRFWSNRPPYFSQMQNNLGRTKQHFFCEQSATRRSTFKKFRISSTVVWNLWHASQTVGDDDDLQKKGHSCGKRRVQFQECPVLLYPVLLSLAPLMMTLLLFPKW